MENGGMGGEKGGGAGWYVKQNIFKKSQQFYGEIPATSLFFFVGTWLHIFNWR